MQQLEFTQNFNDYLQTLVTQEVKERVSKLEKKHINFLEEQKKEYLDSIKNGLKVRVYKGNKKVGELEGLKHFQLETLLTLVSTGQNVLMVGSAGTGKSHAVEQVSQALGFSFYAMSVSPQTTKSDIFGYGDVNGNYVETPFYKAYKDGGVMLFDEIDAGNASVLVAINSALSNGFTSFPIIGNVKRHKDFVMIGTANTFGFGADRQYVGRNQLDAATLDRFAVLDWQVDALLEEALAGTEENQKKWHKFVIDVRGRLASDGVRAIVSPRATIRGRDLLSAGMEPHQVLPVALLNSIPSQSKETVQSIFNNYF